MALYRFKPIPSGRMGTLWTLSTIRNAALIEFGCMGHMLYSNVTLKHAGVNNICKLYSTHIDETDISLGKTDRINHTVENVIKHDNPKVIFLLPSAVPEVIGTDLTAIADELQVQYPDVKFIAFECGGFDVIQHKGVEATLLRLAKTLASDVEKSVEPTFNIIGSCADIFRFQSDAKELLRIMEGAFNIKPNCIMTSDTSVDDIENLGAGHINIVLRQEGEKTAKYLKKRFGTPYFVGRPYGIEGTINWLKEISQLSGLEINDSFINNERKTIFNQISPVMPAMRHLTRSHPEEATLSIGGHADVVKGVLSFGLNELNLHKGACWCNCPYMGTEEIPYYDEVKWMEEVKKHTDGFLMGSGEVIDWAKKNKELQIANPDTKWRLHSYDPPFIGFRGAVHLINLWINDSAEDM